MLVATYLNKTTHIDCYAGLKLLPDNCVDCVATSPPYWALRNYNIPPTKWPEITFTLFGMPITIPDMECCLGLEPTPEAFIGHLVLIFREVKRVLKPTGTCWMNLGDSYSSGAGGNNMKNANVQAMGGSSTLPGTANHKDNVSQSRKPFKNDYIKQKDLVGIPWMAAFALRDDGWYLRQDIIWSKPNPMPESVYDRCTKAHEYLFLLTKSPQYYFDAEAIKTVSSNPTTKMPDGWDTGEGSHGSIHRAGREKGAKVPKSATFKRENSTRESLILPGQTAATHRPDRKDTLPTGFANKRSVWTIATKPFKEAHFATFPEELITDCIKAGSSQYGCCATCGKPYQRVIEKELVPTHKAAKTFVVDARDTHADAQDQGSNRQLDGHKPGHIYATETKGWEATCKCMKNGGRYSAINSARPICRFWHHRSSDQIVRTRWHLLRAQCRLYFHQRQKNV